VNLWLSPTALGLSGEKHLTGAEFFSAKIQVATKPQQLFSLMRLLKLLKLN